MPGEVEENIYGIAPYQVGRVGVIESLEGLPAIWEGAQLFTQAILPGTGIVSHHFK